MNIQQKRILNLFYQNPVKYKGYDLYFTDYHYKYDNVSFEKLINLFINNPNVFKHRCIIFIKNENYKRNYTIGCLNSERWVGVRATRPGKRNNGDKFDDSKFLDLISKIFKELEENKEFYINELKKVLLLK